MGKRKKDNNKKPSKELKSSAQTRIWLWSFLWIVVTGCVAAAVSPWIGKRAETYLDQWFPHPLAPLPNKPQDHRISLLVTKFTNDEHASYRDLAIEALRQREGIDIGLADREIEPVDLGGKEARKKEDRQAFQLLRESGRSMILWGKVIRVDNLSKVRLSWVFATPRGFGASDNIYIPNKEQIELPTSFLKNLDSVLSLIFQLYTSEFVFDAEKRLKSPEGYFKTVRALLDIPRPELVASPLFNTEIFFCLALIDWDRRTAGTAHAAEAARRMEDSLRILHANSPDQRYYAHITAAQAYDLLGRRGVLSEGLARAVSEYEEVLKLAENRSQSDRARANLDLGNAIVQLGARNLSISQITKGLEYLSQAKGFETSDEQLTTIDVARAGALGTWGNVSLDPKIMRNALSEFKKIEARIRAKNESKWLAAVLYHLATVQGMLASNMDKGPERDTLIEQMIDNLKEAIPLLEGEGDSTSLIEANAALAVGMAKRAEPRRDEATYTVAIELMTKTIKEVSRSEDPYRFARLTNSLEVIYRSLFVATGKVTAACNAAEQGIIASTILMNTAPSLIERELGGIRGFMNFVQERGVASNPCFDSVKTLLSDNTP